MVFQNTCVFENAKICDNVYALRDAKVSENAIVSDNAWVFGDKAHIYGKAQICEFTTIYGNAVLKENKKFSEDVCGVDQDVNKAA
ncbi:hypothetical protein [Bartonella queenslandensis]|uniref:hypothetical protein n=1 Tax=Bartonella queenslandensis TaxID=481138 RepID=UPI0003008B8B|nr:hypothetical protein [Bartonella queenslandensis]